MGMTPEQAAALRAEFPPAAIGKKPQPYKKDSPKGKCGECGGWHGMPATHLDYVGHAAVTDRLLQVDPAWSWRPLALDGNGLPVFDAGKNLWIELTVCGVTRLGVGDGLSVKECIGDAIRNAAMRFGVALDLWAKEDLHAGDLEPGETEQAPAGPKRTMRRKPAPTVEEPPTGSAAATGPEPVTTPQKTKLHVVFNEYGVTDKTARLALSSQIIGRQVQSSTELTKQEAHVLIDTLEAMTADAVRALADEFTLMPVDVAGDHAYAELQPEPEQRQL